MNGSPERRKKEGIPVPDPIEPHVGRHYVHGEEIGETVTDEEKIEILRNILAYEEGLLTAIEQNPSLTLEAKKSVTLKQKKIINEARKNLEKALTK